jgi:hypothetical protein
MRMFILSAVLFFVAGAAQAATLNVVGGQLMGASGVLVDGSLYDVQFLDGTCIDLYNGCDEASDFTFQTEASAVLASQALLDQVFLDGVDGLFDTSPQLTNGCNILESCHTITPLLTATTLLIGGVTTNDFFLFDLKEQFTIGPVTIYPDSHASIYSRIYLCVGMERCRLVNKPSPRTFHRSPPRPRPNRPRGEGS